MFVIANCSWLLFELTMLLLRRLTLFVTGTVSDGFVIYYLTSNSFLAVWNPPPLVCSSINLLRFLMFDG